MTKKQPPPPPNAPPPPLFDHHAQFWIAYITWDGHRANFRPQFTMLDGDTKFKRLHTVFEGHAQFRMPKDVGMPK